MVDHVRQHAKLLGNQEVSCPAGDGERRRTPLPPPAAACRHAAHIRPLPGAPHTPPPLPQHLDTIASIAFRVREARDTARENKAAGVRREVSSAGCAHACQRTPARPHLACAPPRCSALVCAGPACCGVATAACLPYMLLQTIADDLDDLLREKTPADVARTPAQRLAAGGGTLLPNDAVLRLKNMLGPGERGWRGPCRLARRSCHVCVGGAAGGRAVSWAQRCVTPRPAAAA